MQKNRGAQALEAAIAEQTVDELLDGAQQMETGETSVGRLLPVGSAYAFQSGRFFNLEGSDFIKGQGDITGKEVAHAIRRAIA